MENGRLVLTSKGKDVGVVSPDVSTEMLACIGQARLMVRDAIRATRYADGAATEKLVATLVGNAEAGPSGNRDTLNQLAEIAFRVYGGGK